MHLLFVQLLIALSILVALVGALETGFRIGRFAAGRRKADNVGSAQVGPIQGAMLGLVGLMLGFSFAGAGSRFIDRQDLITKEANAISTAYLRADLLAPADRVVLQSALRDYAAARLALFHEVNSDPARQIATDLKRTHAVMWDAAVRGAEARPATMWLVLPPINEVIDLHTTRSMAASRHLPALVLALLIASSMIAIGTIGYGCGLGGRRHSSVAGATVVLISASLWTIIDLDHPRVGMIKMSPVPLEALKFDLRPE
jgi:hypothetical protein